MTTKVYHWQLALEMHDGHRLFGCADERDDRVAIADGSGQVPEETNDGVLWLDRSRSLMGGTTPTIPVTDEAGEPRWVFTTVPTLLSLSHRFEWGINAHGIMFHATRDGAEPGKGLLR